MAPTARTRREYRKELLAILFLALGVFFGLCLVSYDPADPALNVASNVRHVNNLGGVVGAYTADILFTIFGISAYVLVTLLFLISILQFLGRQIHLHWRQAIGYGVVIVAAASVLHLRLTVVAIGGQPIEAGGILGGVFGGVLAYYLNRTGAYVISTTVLCLAFFYATQLSVRAAAGFVQRSLFFFGTRLWQFVVIYFHRSRRWLPKAARWTRERWAARRQRAMVEMPPPAPVKINVPRPMAAEVAVGAVTTTKPSAAELPPTVDRELQKTIDRQGGSLSVQTPTVDSPSPAEAASELRRASAAAGESGALKIHGRSDARERKPVDRQLELARISDRYTYPSLALLDSKEQLVTEVDESSLRKNARFLEKKLTEYEIHGRVTEIHPGPVITMYEFEPAAGVKVNKIVGAEDDLSVAMGGRSIRIVAHIPGKAAVGIEIPNSERETVWLKEIIGDTKFQKSHSKLTLALGKNIEGHPVVADLAKMPHLLVAGATGSGKSVAINSMIVSLLYEATPAEVRLILVDPKMLELSMYEGIPHLLVPVVTKPRQATLALQWAVREMERRYRLLSDAGVRNITGYNDRLKRGELKVVSAAEAEQLKASNPEAVAHTGRLAFIVIIIDEMADLMMVSAREIEESVTRLAQMARAAGIHLVLATQRPSVDVITGLIKANFPARIAFKVSAKHDGRTIIDTVGAEKLLGMGDMLFLPPNTSGLVRIHGAFVTETEIQRVVAHVKEQGPAVYDESVLKPPTETANGEEAGEADELYDKAVQLVAETQQASISMIQRRLRIGYNRAARMIERMEMEGVIGPQDGGKPREVFVSQSG